VFGSVLGLSGRFVSTGIAIVLQINFVNIGTAISLHNADTTTKLIQQSHFWVPLRSFSHFQAVQDNGAKHPRLLIHRFSTHAIYLIRRPPFRPSTIIRHLSARNTYIPLTRRGGAKAKQKQKSRLASFMVVVDTVGSQARKQAKQETKKGDVLPTAHKERSTGLKDQHYGVPTRGVVVGPTDQYGDEEGNLSSNVCSLVAT